MEVIQSGVNPLSAAPDDGENGTDKPSDLGDLPLSHHGSNPSHQSQLHASLEIFLEIRTKTWIDRLVL